MELKLVYRILRALSDSALDFYSEVHVEGAHNVPADGPLIVVSCHHNEILDIATLAVTVPHRRPLCFWAKSSLFRNPLARAILLSSGSIPVRRNPNSTADPTNADRRATESESEARQALFRETFRALDEGRGGTVGVFPEGTSYTQPGIVQVKEGAAWAALEYLRWLQQGGESEVGGRVLVVPVGIVHTAKTRYQSRMAVRWGLPIDVADFARDQDVQTDEDMRVAARKLTEEIERRMVELTVNAPDWDTLYVARMARDMLWDDERNIAVSQFTDVSQALIDLFSTLNPPPSLPRARRSLLNYYSLLHYSNISHAHLSALLPSPHHALPTCPRTISLLVRQCFNTALHPRLLLFFPPFLLHLPAYALAGIAERALASPRNEETHAQYKAIFGMVGAGAVYGVLGCLLARMVGRLPILEAMAGQAVLEVVQRVGVWLVRHGGVVRDGLVLVGSVYVTAKVLSRWHNALVGANLRQTQRLATAFKLARGICSAPSSDLTLEQLELYGSPPEPPFNPFIKRRPAQAAPTPVLPASKKTRPTRVPPSWTFIRPLLEARREASYALSDALADLETHVASLDDAVSSTSRDPTGLDSNSPAAALHRLRQLGACF
ncbi:uncharacterized protein B0H18DRAFT_1120386 [Fomitopsis serialis]|uniref:uncharacterized protein n=1 Tax=Fomitopsis serialis TaxID=139415 RepID=UPI0020086817|nr:uncharacterized protein B0H18DRAFT_1120386 [Neoantrodia serialis]KAH9923533.1 hypothetical protein B0H18DRAFT_1120386 [Neoantrodia serialis]